MSKKLTVKEFIKKARKVHGNKYDYSKVEYKGAFEKVCIICPIHGEFWQTPANHLSGKGCKKCAQVLLWDKRGRKTTESIKNEFKEIHGDKYDYSKVEFVNTNTKVCIICHEKDEFGSEHGEFWQTPSKHLLGQGCPKCGLKILWDKRGRVTTEQFIERGKNVHNNKYVYSKTQYKRRDRKVCIICPVHGEFWQTPAKHLSGQGCPECSSKLNKQECILWRKLQQKYPNMTIIHEYHNSDILGKKSIDIFIDDLKIGIEYQGGQHFKPIKIFGGYNGFLKIAKRDEEKYKECKENGIKLLYFTTETWNITENYIDKVYTNFEKLCEEIDLIKTKNIKEQP